MSDWIGFWLAKIAVDAGLTLVGLLVLVIGYGVYSLTLWLKQRKCPHEHFGETRACDAICRSCGKNLGFIGAVREARRAK